MTKEEIVARLVVLEKETASLAALLRQLRQDLLDLPEESVVGSSHDIEVVG